MERDIRVCARWGFVCRRGGIGGFGFMFTRMSNALGIFSSSINCFAKFSLAREEK